VGTRKDLEEALQFAAEGKVKATIEEQPLASINEIFDRLKKGKVNGRIVLDIARESGTKKSTGAKASKSHVAA
jgi:propanol-preferring alcohol dehydrogenase